MIKQLVLVCFSVYCVSFVFIDQSNAQEKSYTDDFFQQKLAICDDISSLELGEEAKFLSKAKEFNTPEVIEGILMKPNSPHASYLTDFIQSYPNKITSSLAKWVDFHSTKAQNAVLNGEIATAKEHLTAAQNLVDGACLVSNHKDLLQIQTEYFSNKHNLDSIISIWENFPTRAKVGEILFFNRPISPGNWNSLQPITSYKPGEELYALIVFPGAIKFNKNRKVVVDLPNYKSDTFYCSWQNENRNQFYLVEQLINSETHVSDGDFEQNFIKYYVPFAKRKQQNNQELSVNIMGSVGSIKLDSPIEDFDNWVSIRTSKRIEQRTIPLASYTNAKLENYLGHIFSQNNPSTNLWGIRLQTTWHEALDISSGKHLFDFAESYAIYLDNNMCYYQYVRLESRKSQSNHIQLTTLPPVAFSCEKLYIN